MEFKDKTIFIISYEAWGGMMMSKQHYAVELAKLENNVYFINHTDRRNQLKRGKILIENTGYKNLYSIRHRYWHPYFFKYKFPLLHSIILRFYVKYLLRKLKVSPDIVWNFDLGNHLPLKYFPKKALKIYMPVDVGGKDEVEAANQADLIISVTNEILSRYETIVIPKLKINHGVASHFIINEILDPTPNNFINIGYSGSLVRNDIDFDIFINLINKYPNLKFHFWGECDINNSSIHLPQDVSDKTKHVLKILSNSKNVKLYGKVSPETLSKNLKNMDILLVAYNIKNDQNHHKILEYLGSGKVIVSSFMSSYQNETGLIEMLQTPNNNKGLIDIFEKVVNNIQYYNCIELQKKRINFAAVNTYEAQIKKIQNFINASFA